MTVHLQIIPVADAWDMSEDRAVVSDGACVGVREVNVPPGHSDDGRDVLVQLCDWGQGSNLDIHSALQAGVDEERDFSDIPTGANRQACHWVLARLQTPSQAVLLWFHMADARGVP